MAVYLPSVARAWQRLLGTPHPFTVSHRNYNFPKSQTIFGYRIDFQRNPTILKNFEKMENGKFSTENS